MKPSSTTSSTKIRKIQYSLTICIILFKIIYLSLNQFHCRYRFEHLFLTHLWTVGQQSPWACSVRPVIPAVHSCCWRLLAVFLWLGTRSGWAARIFEYLILFDRSRSMWSDKSCLVLFPPYFCAWSFTLGYFWETVMLEDSVFVEISEGNAFMIDLMAPLRPAAMKPVELVQLRWPSTNFKQVLALHAGGSCLSKTVIRQRN